MSAPKSLADRVRVFMAVCFPLGAALHFVWLWQNGDLMYRGPAPEWAPAFWFAVCAVDFVVCWALLTRPRLGLRIASATMAVTLWVNWTQFPTFQYKFNWVLIGLTAFGVFVFAVSPWLWLKLNASSERSGG